MRGLLDLLSVTVLAVETGAEVGEVEDVLLDLDTARIYGFTILNAAWFTNKKLLMFEDIYRVGPDAVMIKNDQVIRDFDSNTVDGEAICNLKSLTNRNIFTEAGLQLGTLTDVAFDPVTGELKSYTVSDGTITDLLYGRRNLPMPHAQTVCEDRIIVPEAMANLLQLEKSNV